MIQHSQENPIPYFIAAREQHPWLAKSPFAYVVHEYAAMDDLLKMDDKMRPAQEQIVEIMDAAGTPWGRFQNEIIFAYTGDAHKRLRDIVAPTFTPKNANRSRSLMRAAVSGLLDEWAPKRAIDFEEFASYFPITVMCRLIGASPSVIPRLRASMEAIGKSYSMDRNLLPELQQAVIVMDDFVQELVAERRQRKTDHAEPDLLDALIKATDHGTLNQRELSDLLITLFAGGFDTSKNFLTMAMYLMLDRPDDYARCAEDFAFSCKVVDEVFRYRALQSMPRLITEDIVYRDVLLPAGSMLFFALTMAGRDPKAFADPDRFDPERQQEKRHMAFGRGAHMCLGQHIARAQIEEGFHLIAQRITKPKLAGPITWRSFPGAWGLKGLQITFEPGASAKSI